MKSLKLTSSPVSTTMLFIKPIVMYKLLGSLEILAHTNLLEEKTENRCSWMYPHLPFPMDIPAENEKKI